MSKPTVFLGSSAEQIPILNPIQTGLYHTANVTAWTSAFSPGNTTLNTLVTKANESDFAVFIFGPDDFVETRDVRIAAPRDNVVFEAGLFGGVIGMNRTFIVHDKSVKLPSDLQGLTPVRYDAAKDPDGEGAYVCAQLNQVIGKLGWRGSEGLSGQLEGHWWQFALGATKVEQSVVSLIHVKRQASRQISLTGQAWSEAGAAHARFWSMATTVKEEEKTLLYFWEGDWPGHDGAPAFFGKGEIKLESSRRANGYFTVHSDGEVDPRERKAALYLRANPEDVAIMTQDTEIGRRKDVIKRQLERRGELAFA